MIGHLPILAMRRSGRKPNAVWVSDFPDCMLAESITDSQTVRVAGDTPELLDLRFLLGVEQVHVEGPDPDRVRRVAAACQAFAKVVVASTMQVVNSRWEVIHLTYNGEVLWPI